MRTAVTTWWPVPGRLLALDQRAREVLRAPRILFFANSSHGETQDSCEACPGAAVEALLLEEAKM